MRDSLSYLDNLLANQKARNAIVGAETLLKSDSCALVNYHA